MSIGTKSNLCDIALTMLRQDIGYSSSNNVKGKCDRVWYEALNTVSMAHNWKTAITESTSNNVVSVTADDHVLYLIPYALARELAIPITGRKEDRATADEMYKDMLTTAITKDLEDEMTALRASTSSSDKFAVLVLDMMKQYYSIADSDLGNGRPKPQPRGIAVLKAHINSVKENVRKDILISHDWSFAKKETPVTSTMTTDERYTTNYPADAVKIIACFDDHENKAETVLRDGPVIYSIFPLSRIVYIFDTGDTDDWSPLAIRAYIAKVAEVVALANPELFGNSTRIAMFSQAAKEALNAAKLADSRQTFAATSVYGRNYLYDVMTGKRTYKYNGRPFQW